MKSSTRLDSAVFQLTPTRTRCDLVITANGKTEKIASGLVIPFLAHLKTAKDQMDKGGYSIVLEPQPGSGAPWFTRGIVERFVRFVSTPEILERVYTLELEILQMEEAITVQKNSNTGLSTVESQRGKPVETGEGIRPQPDLSNEKALVLYEPGASSYKSNEPNANGNTKVQLMKVLETRKTVVKKEQGMAFARAVAAGFDIDQMTPLMLFAESFGATRLMEACMRFKELWKRKHESGQWVEIEAAEAISSQPDFSSMNASGIVLSTSDNNGNAEQEHAVDQHSPSSHQFQGQYPHPIYPPWPMLSSPGSMPAFQGYPMQGIPYYQNYPGSNPYFYPMHPSGEESTPNAGQRIGRRHSMDSGTEPDTWDADALRTRSLDTALLDSGEPRKKSGRSKKNQSGMVVIRNLNYISKGKNSSDSESDSASDSEDDEGSGDSSTHKSSLKSSNRKESNGMFAGKKKEETVIGEADGGHWQAFQSFLLKNADEAERAVDQGMFGMEKNVQARRRQNALGDDPLVFEGRDLDVDDYQAGDVSNLQKMSGRFTHKSRSSNDELLSSKTGQSVDGGGVDIESAEINRRRGGYRSTSNDDFIVNRREQKFGNSLLDPMVGNGIERANNISDRTNNVDDDSYVLTLRSSSLGPFGAERNAIDMDSEFPSGPAGAEDSSNRSQRQVEYEPDYLRLMPERDTQKDSQSYDPALDYSLQNESSLNKKTKDGAADSNAGSKKLEPNRKSKLNPDTSKKVGPIRKGKPSKLSPLDEARARAERLRTFKADLQKMKKEKEEEDMKRLEALKLERQKRIAARSSNGPALSGSKQSKKQLPTKASPTFHKGSKFSDSKPGIVSPLQRLPITTTSTGSIDSLKGSKFGKLGTGSHSKGNLLTRSASSLPESKKDKNDATLDTVATTSRIRRLSEPKMSSSPLVSSVKSRNGEVESKPKVSSGPESKKVSAILNHDKTKAATLPELKILSTKASNSGQEKTARKEVPQPVGGGKSTSLSGHVKLKRDDDKLSPHTDGDDGPVIEKTVVMLEKPSVPTGKLPSVEGTTELPKEHSSNFKIKEMLEPVLDYGAIHAPVSPLTRDEIDREPTVSHMLDKQKAPEATVDTQNADMTSTIRSAEKPYEAPFARVSSQEDPCTRNSQYGKAPPSSFQTVETGRETLKAHVPDPPSLKLEKIPEASNKHQVKESPKGFRRLLKFGRKGHHGTTNDNNSESDNISLNGSEADDNGANATSSSEVNTLKSLISQDETPTAGYTPQKSSRHFSLLSPFRSKNSEKKMTNTSVN